MPDRDELLAMLRQTAPEAQHAGRVLTLPSLEAMDVIDPDKVGEFRTRRRALFAEFMRQRDNLSQLGMSEYCQYQLLEELFREHEVRVSACWQRVHAVRGAEALPAFNHQVVVLSASKCVQVYDPTP